MTWCATSFPGAAMRRRLKLSAFLAPLALAACLDPDPVPESNYGVIGLTTVVSNSDTILSPEALFYRTGLLSLPTSRVSTDQCQVAVHPTPSQGGALPRFLDAGDSVAVSTVDLTKYLFPTVDVDLEAYVLRDSLFPFQPGENVTITVPGAAGGFTNGTISVLTARGFTLGPIDPSPPVDEGLDLTWSPTGDDSTKMLISLQYGVGQLEPNQQIFCSLIDDGAAEVPPGLVTQWRNATTGSRKVEAARWRVALKEVNGGVLLVVSAFEVDDFID
jgi:hypothetical protein